VACLAAIHNLVVFDCEIIPRRDHCSSNDCYAAVYEYETVLRSEARVPFMPVLTSLYPCQSRTLSKNSLLINAPLSSMISFLNSDHGRNPAVQSRAHYTSNRSSGHNIVPRGRGMYPNYRQPNYRAAYSSHRSRHACKLAVTLTCTSCIGIGPPIFTEMATHPMLRPPYYPEPTALS